MSTLKFIIVTLCIAAMTAPSRAGTFQGIGDLPGGGFESQARGISADGSTVVGYSRSGSGTQAFRWTAAGGMQPLGYLPDVNPSGTPFSQANAVSGDGSIVVGHSAGRAFRWTSAGMQDLGSLGGANGFSYAFSISADGSTIVGFTDATSDPVYSTEAFRWTSANGMQGLGDLGGNTPRSRGHGVTADGSLIVGESDAPPGQSVVWTSGGVAALPNIPPMLDGYTNLASAVSGDGSTVVGMIWWIDGRTAYRWTSADGMELLSGPGMTSITARAASADGSIIVGQGYDGDRIASIWDEEHELRSLKAVLESEHGLDLSDWTLTEAFGVSADGLTIIGTGINPAGDTEGWIAHVPEPGTGALIAAMTMLGWRRRRGK